MKLYFFIGLFISVINFTVNAQVGLVLKSNESILSVDGTSTIHDWEMVVENMKGNLLMASMDKIESIQEGEISFQVTSLKSNHSLMNKKTYSALKKDKYPIIKGKIIKIYSVGEIYKVELELSIAGITRNITSNFKNTKINSNQIKVKGNFALKLTDFDIEPPEAIMGTIKAGQDVTIKYSLLFEKN